MLAAMAKSETFNAALGYLEYAAPRRAGSAIVHVLYTISWSSFLRFPNWRCMQISPAASQSATE